MRRLLRWIRLKAHKHQWGPLVLDEKYTDSFANWLNGHYRRDCVVCGEETRCNKWTGGAFAPNHRRPTDDQA